MPIVIMPNGEMVDSVTGNPVDTPRNRLPMLEGDMARFISKVPSQRSMNPEMMQNMTQRTGASLTVMEKMQMLMDMGLTEGEAIDAIAMEESAGQIDPNAFSGMDRGDAMMGAATAGMGALGGVPMGGQAPMPMPRPRPQMPNDMGADRTMNPMDTITSRNAPST